VLLLGELVSATNVYLNQDSKSIKVPLVRQITQYVLRILKCFGVFEDEIFPQVDEEASSNFEEKVTPLLNAVAKFREQIKEKSKEGPKEIFKVCDEFRDDVLPFLGVRLEDPPGRPTIWKLQNAEELIRERQTKIEEKAKKEEEK